MEVLKEQQRATIRIAARLEPTKDRRSIENQNEMGFLTYIFGAQELEMG